MKKFFAVSSLPEAVDSGANYIVYLKGNASYVQMQFRDILLNRVLMQETYTVGLGLDGAISQMVHDIESQVLSTLPSYCQK